MLTQGDRSREEPIAPFIMLVERPLGVLLPDITWCTTGQ